MGIGFLFFFVFLIFSCEFGKSDKLPEEFKKCSKKDIACLKSAIQDALPKLKDGIPKLGVPALDPLYLGTVVIGSGSQLVGVEQKYKNTKLVGLSSSKINNLIFDLDQGKIGMNFTAPVVLLNASYEANGKMLSLPIYGHGPASLTLEGFHGDILFDVETRTRNSEKYLRVKQFTFEIVLDNMIIQLDNLFDGNPLLSDNMNKVMTENWEPIYKEVIADYAKVYGNKLTELMGNIFAKVPISELFLD